MNAPHDTSFTNETVSSELDNDGMTWARSSEISAYNSTARDDGLSAEDDVLWACDCSSARNFISRVSLDVF